MARVQLMDGVTVSENLLKGSWPAQHTTLDESVVRAAEEVKRLHGLKSFPTADHYFAAVDGVRSGQSPLKAAILYSALNTENGHGQVVDPVTLTEVRRRDYRRVQMRAGSHSWRKNENSSYRERNKRRAILSP